MENRRRAHVGTWGWRDEGKMLKFSLYKPHELAAPGPRLDVRWWRFHCSFDNNVTLASMLEKILARERK